MSQAAPGGVLRTDVTEFGGRALDVGARYRIELYDCCIEGWIVGRFEGVWYVERKPGSGVFDWPDAARFDVGQIGPDWGQWSVTRLEEGAA